MTTTLSSSPGRDERLLQPGREHQHRREHVDDERHAAGREQRREPARRTGCARCSESGMAIGPRLRYPTARRPSTMRTRAARHAGQRRGDDADRRSAATNCITTVSSPTKKIGNSDPIASANARASGNVSAMPMQPADERDAERLGEDQQRDEAVGEAQRLQRRVLGVALARRHRHRVRHHRHDDDDHDERHRLDREQDRLGHRDEAELERLLGLGQRFRERVLERRVDRLATPRRPAAGP